MRFLPVMTVLAAALGAASCFAASSVPGKWPLPQASALPPAIDAPRDRAYPGNIRLDVDATDVLRGVHHIRETVPVQGPQRLTLLFPQWIPGDHVPPNSLDQLAGLVVTAAGKTLRWQRDTVEAYAFHIDVPAGVQAVELNYQFVIPSESRIGPVLSSPTMFDLQWQSHVLYPAGYYARGITVDPSVTLPPNWQFASSLDGARRQGDVVRFATVTLDTLVDSPVMGARWFKQYPLSDDPVPVRLDVAANTEAELTLPASIIDGYRREVAQAYKLFGGRHYDHYDLMVWLSRGFGPSYFEQRRSGENAMSPGIFNNPVYQRYAGAPFHGFVHSWNGMYRSPAPMWTPDFNTPQQVTLLWVFEGLTMYWKDVLDARAGIVTQQQALDEVENNAADYSLRSGLQWRTLQDVSNELVMQHGNSNIYPEGRTQVWPDWQLDTSDTYTQGELLWLDIDTLIRQRSHGKRSLDDFARTFFGVNDGSMVTLTYTFDDLVAAFNAVEPYDWATFLRERVDSQRPAVDLDGVERGGYKLALTHQIPASQQASEEKSGGADLRFSLGLSVDKEGAISAVIWGSPAWQAGLVTGAKVLTVNGEPFTTPILKTAITAASQGGQLDLKVARNGIELAQRIDWHGGLLYPHMQRVADQPALLDDIFKPRP